MDENLIEKNFHIDQLANSGQRLLNFLIDTFIVIVVFSLLSRNLPIDGNRMLFLVVYLVYYSMLEWFFGKTIGKYLTKTTVICDNGEKITFGTALMRSIIRLIPFETFTYLGRIPYGWHDKFTKTIILPDKEI